MVRHLKNSLLCLQLSDMHTAIYLGREHALPQRTTEMAVQNTHPALRMGMGVLIDRLFITLTNIKRKADWYRNLDANPIVTTHT